MNKENEDIEEFEYEDYPMDYFPEDELLEYFDDGEGEYYEEEDEYEDESEFSNEDRYDESWEDPYYESISDTLEDFDFSDFRGDFKSSMRSINGKLKRQAKRKPDQEIHSVKVPQDRKVVVEGRKRPTAPTKQRLERKKPVSKKRPPGKKRIRRKPGANIPVGHSTEKYNPRGKGDRAVLRGRGKKKISKILVPDDKKVIVEGVSDFILSQDKGDTATKNIGYYKGKKLKELVLTFNNNSALDFNLELFNPSMPLDYLQSTSLNLNDKVQVAGESPVSYSDVLFNLLANPTLIVNAKLVVSGPLLVSQINQAMIFKNKSIEGKEKVAPFSMPLSVDVMQVQNDIVYFDIVTGINRPYIPDGMDIIEYVIRAGMTVTFAFYYKQISLKKFFFKEARQSKGLL
jgi:hypothetical protein